MKTKNHLFVLSFISIILILLFGIYYYLSMQFGISIPCVFHEVTGFFCPGCGITRMLFSLLRLEFYQAFRYNNLLFISLPFVVLYFIDFIVKFLSYKNNYLYKKISNKVWYLLLIVTIVFGIMRNIPMFEFLQPTII